jgi:hypothetical protein
MVLKVGSLGLGAESAPLRREMADAWSKKPEFSLHNYTV